jgi:SAM-dependent methyltransferase
MEAPVYQDMARFQARHWWFRARREILSEIVGHLNLPESAAILEIGCGTGGNLDMLKRHGQVTAMENDAGAAAWAKKITGLEIRKGRLPDHISCTGRYDLVCLFDVLEHVDNDQAALIRVAGLLKPGGRVILTVPAHMRLYGPHDRLLHHFRRYGRTQLKRLLTHAGLDIDRLSYLNALLFPAAVFTRCLDFFSKKQYTIGYDVPHPVINQLLYKLFSIEKKMVCAHDLPVGLSLMAVAGRSIDGNSGA